MEREDQMQFYRQNIPCYGLKMGKGIKRQEKLKALPKTKF
jgi:hypothetical protein